MNKYTKWKLYAGGLAVVLDVLMYFHFFIYKMATPQLDAFIITPLLLLIAELLIEALSRLDLVEPIPRELQTLGAHLATLGQDSLSAKASAFNERSKGEYLGKYLNKFVQDVTRALDIEEAQYAVTHQQLAIYSYTEFWWTLVAMQRDLGKDKSIDVRAVHCFDPGVFDEKLLGPQRAFIENGGTIERILCGKQQTPPDKTRKVADDMTRIGIKVRYHKRDEDAMRFNYAWDYMYIPKTKEAVIWAAAGQEGRIEQAVFSQAGVYFRRDLEDLWNSIRAKSDPLGSAEASEPAASIAAVSGGT